MGTATSGGGGYKIWNFEQTKNVRGLYPFFVNNIYNYQSKKSAVGTFKVKFLP